MGIRLNIDLFDSDTNAVETSPRKGEGYIICNVAKSTKKLDLISILISAHDSFFNCSLFSGYSAQDPEDTFAIRTFLSERNIIEDLSPYYDIIGGNMLKSGEGKNKEKEEMISSIIKIVHK